MIGYPSRNASLPDTIMLHPEHHRRSADLLSLLLLRNNISFAFGSPHRLSIVSIHFDQLGLIPFSAALTQAFATQSPSPENLFARNPRSQEQRLGRVSDFFASFRIRILSQHFQFPAFCFGSFPPTSPQFSLRRQSREPNTTPLHSLAPTVVHSFVTYSLALVKGHLFASFTSAFKL